MIRVSGLLELKANNDELQAIFEADPTQTIEELTA